MYYDTHGGGESLMLIAGLGTDLTVYGPIIERLSQDFTVLAFDNRGAGRTDKPDIPYTMEMMAEDTVEFMKEVGTEKAHVLGISMGGRIAMALAHPDKVKSLVPTSPSATGRTWFLPYLIILTSRIGARMDKSAARLRLRTVDEGIAAL